MLESRRFRVLEQSLIDRRIILPFQDETNGEWWDNEEEAVGLDVECAGDNKVQ